MIKVSGRQGSGINPPQPPFAKGGRKMVLLAKGEGKMVLPFEKEQHNPIPSFEKEQHNPVPPFEKGGLGGISLKPPLMIASLTLLIMLASGCSSVTEPVRVEQDFGNSVRQMIAAQTLNPMTVANPDPEPVMGLDGPKAMGVLEVYREDIPKPAEIQNVINISVGGN